MIQRKAVGSSPIGVASQATIAGGRPSQSNRLGIIVFAIFLSFVFILILLSGVTPTVEPRIDGPNVLRTPIATLAPISTSPPTKNLDNCGLINDLLKGTIPSSSEGLPSAGKPTNFGAVFWLKTPVLRAKLPESGDDVVLLKYNKYLPRQHTLKWSNTVSILNEYRDGRVFPKMYAFCKDPGDGFHYILVEWIEKHPSELSKPTSFNECFDRGERILNLLVILDEEMHLAFMDVKKGQWMSRSDEKSFVLQDVDDIVRSPWTPTKEAGDLYYDQVERAQSIVQGYLSPKAAIGYVKKLWDEKFFPIGYTIRYTMTLLGEILLGDMGFNWERDCRGMPPTFMSCFRDIIRWAAAADDTWPAPKQVMWAYRQCKINGSFNKDEAEAKRDPASWRDAPPISSNTPRISCHRSSDNLKKTDASYTENLSLCYMTVNGTTIRARFRNETTFVSCCRARQDDPCYYAVSDKLCINL